VRGFALGLSLSLAFIIGCLAGPHLTPSADAQVRETYRYTCIGGASNVERLTRLIDGQGRMGRELITVATRPNDMEGNQWCFRIH